MCHTQPPVNTHMISVHVFILFLISCIIPHIAENVNTHPHNGGTGGTRGARAPDGERSPISSFAKSLKVTTIVLGT